MLQLISALAQHDGKGKEDNRKWAGVFRDREESSPQWQCVLFQLGRLLQQPLHTPRSPQFSPHPSLPRGTSWLCCGPLYWQQKAPFYKEERWERVKEAELSPFLGTATDATGRHSNGVAFSFTTMSPGLEQHLLKFCPARRKERSNAGWVRGERKKAKVPTQLS